MRWPIQIQLLLPTLSVVVVAIVLTAVASAWTAASRASRQQEQRLRRVVGTLTEAAFPLSKNVLRQMSGLSGAEFFLLDRQGRVEAGTRAVGDDELAALERIRSNRKLSLRTGTRPIPLGGRRHLGARVPVGRRSSSAAESLIVLYPEDRWQATARQAALPALLIGAAAAAGAVGVTTLLARRFVRPIRQIGDRAAAIAAGDFRAIPLGHRQDEVGDLALSINRMTEQLSRYEQEVRHNERLRTLGQLGAGMAHQLRNAATGALMAVELHQNECRTGSDCESLSVAVRQLRLMESHLKRFLTLGRPGSAAHELCDLRSLVDGALSLVRPACRHAKIELGVVQPADKLWVSADRDALTQALINLVLNAMEAVSGHPNSPRRVQVQLERDNGNALVCVADTGPGPATDAVPRLFEPFMTDKSDGTGLGLAVACQVVEEHQGTIRWDRRDHVTRFIVEIPLTGQPTSHAAPVDC